MKQKYIFKYKAPKQLFHQVSILHRQEITTDNCYHFLHKYMSLTSCTKSWCGCSNIRNIKLLMQPENTG